MKTKGNYKFWNNGINPITGWKSAKPYQDSNKIEKQRAFKNKKINLER